LKVGDVATVALIDKGSVIIAILLAWLLAERGYYFTPYSRRTSDCRWFIRYR